MTNQYHEVTWNKITCNWKINKLTLIPRSAATEPPKECPTISILYPLHSQPSPRREDKNPVVTVSDLSAGSSMAAVNVMGYGVSNNKVIE